MKDITRRSRAHFSEDDLAPDGVHELATIVEAYPALGDLPVNQVTREQIGNVIRKVREAGRSLASIEQIRNPLRGYYQSLIESKTLPRAQSGGGPQVLHREGRQPQHEGAAKQQRHGGSGLSISARSSTDP